jgi:hypothetical protein
VACRQQGSRQGCQPSQWQLTARAAVAVASGQHLPEEQLEAVLETGQADGVFQRALEQQGRQVVLQVRCRPGCMPGLENAG